MFVYFTKKEMLVLAAYTKYGIIIFFKFTKLEIICSSIILSVKKICLKIPSYFCLPPVAIVQKFFFVVQQLLMCLGSKLEVRTLKNKEKRNVS